MASVKDWISSFRLRTLPLALSCILAGSLFAFIQNKFDGVVLSLAILTTILLQVLSNIANDYGDGVKGTDNDERVGPARAIQSKKISINAMRNAIIINSILAMISGICLVYYSLKDASFPEMLIFIALGVFSVIAAITYTVGKKAYGYSGFGDLFVFIFFGLVGVLGVYYLHTKMINWQIVFPAMFTGLMSAGVLNMNNMRDIVNDEKSGKRTLVVKFGFEKAKVYHTFLLTMAMLSWIIGLSIVVNVTYPFSFLLFISVLPFILFVKNIIFVQQATDHKSLDPELKKLALGTFVTTLLSWIIALILI